MARPKNSPNPSSIRQNNNTRPNQTANSSTVTGTVLTPQVFVRIRWGWLAMLATQLFLTAVFLVLTIVATRAERLQIIKGSNLAALCAMDPATRRHVGNIDDLDALTQRAKTLRVRIERGSSGVAVWLRMRRGK